MTSPLQDVGLVAAGVLAGLIGAAGGITSLISYPALLAVGIAPLPANVTNAVALFASLPGSALGSRPELRGRGAWIRKWAPLTIVGSAAGVALLLLTPDQVFNHLVPYLLLAAAAVLFAQPVIARWQARRAFARAHLLWPLGLFFVSVYSGYFGAGSGIMVIALLLLAVDRDFVKANALKNVILGVADVVAALGFILFGPVRLAPALWLALGLLIGSFFGPRLTRRLPAGILRVAAGLLGVGLAVWLFVNPRA